MMKGRGRNGSLMHKRRPLLGWGWWPPTRGRLSHPHWRWKRPLRHWSPLRHVWRRPKLLHWRRRHDGWRENLTRLLWLTLPRWLPWYLHWWESHDLGRWWAKRRNRGWRNGAISKGTWRHGSAHTTVSLWTIRKCRWPAGKQRVRPAL